MITGMSCVKLAVEIGVIMEVGPDSAVVLNIVTGYT
jgi:hypothetical protein